MSKRRLVFSIQSRLERDPSGVIRTQAGYARYEAWSGFLTVFDEVVLVCRVASVAESRGSVVEGPGVRVLEVPYYHGVTQLAARLPALWRFAAETVKSDGTFYGGRMPDVVGSFMEYCARRAGIPFLVQVVGDPGEVLRSGVGGRFGRMVAPLAAAWLRQATRHADAIIYVTRSTLQHKYPHPAHALVLARSNVELPREAVADEPRIYSRRSADSPFKLVTVGSQEQNYKGHDLLIRAVRTLDDVGVDVEATIVGGGRLHGELVELAEQLGVSKSVKFAGKLESADLVRSHIERADLFVLPSRTEGLPRALIEAMALGTASIGARVGGVPELLSDRWLFAPDDHEAIVSAIVSVYDDPQLLTFGALEQWKTAKDIAVRFSGSAVLEAFLRNWTEKQYRGASRGDTENE